MIFMTFSIVYLFKRRIFTRILVTVFWLAIGITNGYMLMKRVTPFNAQDLKVAQDGLTLVTSYFNPFELVLVLIGIAAVIVWVVSMWKRGGQFEGKVRRVLALVIIAASFGSYAVLRDLAVEHRVVSTYFGNIAFAYEDYGLPYCFMASVFNTGINEPNGYDEEAIVELTDNRKMTESTIGFAEDEMPNIVVIQLESYFDVEEAEAFSSDI